VGAERLFAAMVTTLVPGAAPTWAWHPGKELVRSVRLAAVPTRAWRLGTAAATGVCLAVAPHVGTAQGRGAVSAPA